GSGLGFGRRLFYRRLGGIFLPSVHVVRRFVEIAKEIVFSAHSHLLVQEAAVSSGLFARHNTASLTKRNERTPILISVLAELPFHVICRGKLKPVLAHSILSKSHILGLSVLHRSRDYLGSHCSGVPVCRA